MESQDRKYSSPRLKELTRQQAIKVVAQRKNCSEEQAAKFVDGLRGPLREQERNTDRKRSA